MVLKVGINYVRKCFFVEKGCMKDQAKGYQTRFVGWWGSLWPDEIPNASQPNTGALFVLTLPSTKTLQVHPQNK